MKAKLKTYLQDSRQAGLTLIEVIAAIAILGTILVGMVLSKSSHTHQLALAQRQIIAVRVVDELIADWWTSSQGVPVGEYGLFGKDESLVWETRVVQNEVIEKLGAKVVRVEVRELNSAKSKPASEQELLFAVELVLPAPAKETEKTESLDNSKTKEGGRS